MDSPKSSTFRRIWDALASLELTIVSLLLLMVLVVLCTLAQRSMGTFGAVATYMRSVVVWWHFPALPFRIPIFPGGVLVGLIFLVNLTCALLKRLDLSWRRAGLWTVHAGLILLVAGEFSTGAFQHEAQMAIQEGQTVNYTESPREVELAIINSSDPAHDQVYSVPASLLKAGSVVSIPGTPITIRVKRFFENATLGMRQPGDTPAEATAGVGANVKIAEAPPVASDNEMNQTSALVEPVVSGQSFGTWLVSMALGAPQSFLAGGQTYNLSLRLRRDYLPYSVTLKKFSHDVYAGTDIPKNFSSLVHLSNPGRGEERDVLIYMNQPLRYEGRTFYQASWGDNGRLSVLQVVQNPGWRMPYISCAIITLGLLIHFGLSLQQSLRQRRTA